MVFRCPICGIFVKGTILNNRKEIGTCKKCNTEYFAKYHDEWDDTGEYTYYVSVWPVNDLKGEITSHKVEVG